MPGHDDAALQPDQGRQFSVGPNQVHVKIEADQTEGAFSMIHWTLPAEAAAPPPHIHRKGSETFFVLEGEVEFTVGGEKVVAGPGMRVHMAAGVPHTLGNMSGKTARTLEIFAPGSLLGLVEEIAKIFAAGGPPDFARMREAMERFDSELAAG